MDSVDRDLQPLPNYAATNEFLDCSPEVFPTLRARQIAIASDVDLHVDDCNSMLQLRSNSPIAPACAVTRPKFVDRTYRRPQRVRNVYFDS